MKKLYMLTLACTLCCIATTHAQITRYWRGGANGLWSSTSNWSADGVSTGASVPNSSNDIAVFDQGTPTVNVSGAVTLLSLVVTNNVTAKITATANSTFQLTGPTTTNYALRVDAGSRLENINDPGVGFIFQFNNNAKGLVNGTWYFGASGAGAGGSSYTLPAATGQGNRLDINGTMILGLGAVPHTLASAAGYCFFNGGSECRVERNGGGTPVATWASTSTINITGNTNVVTAINVVSPYTIGNLVYNSPGLTSNLTWALPTSLVVGGNFQVLNTNNNNLILGFAGAAGATINYTVNGNFELSGNSIITLGNSNPGVDASWILQVNGSYSQTGGTFNLRDASVSTATYPTELRIKGNFTQTAGTFGSPATANPANEIYAVELNGTTVQTINISSGTIDNTNNVVTLRMNNVNGAVLAAPLSVGRLSWATANKGKITSGTNLLMVNNIANDALTVNSPGTNAFVSGLVGRRTNAAAALTLPTGATSYRPVDVIPNTATLSSYSGQYVASSYGVTAVSTPLYKVSNAEYWNISKMSGSDAAVQLTVSGAVPGAFGPDKLVVAHFNSGTSEWESVKGTTGTELTPGNSTTGTVTSDVLSSFSPFTFGVVPGSPLPVYLVSFNAKKVSNTAAKLDWTITASSNPDRFEVLRSEDGANFSAIGTVKAATQQLTFTFQDNQLPKKTTYYQLRMIDQQGVVMMSKIVSVFNNGEGWLINSMMPTLVTSQAKLNISASSRANIRLAVTDMYGRIVHQQQSALSAGSQDVWLNLSALPAGAYQVTGILENGVKTGSIRFVKQ